MRQRAWIAIALAGLGLAVGIAGREVPGTRAWNLLAGLLMLAGIIVAVSLFAFWRRLAPDPMPGLFVRPGPRERWCNRCGHPTARAGACRTCGHSVASRGK